MCIPAYRQPLLLARAIESVFSQDFSDFEIIVTDDSEKGEISGVIEKWRADGRLTYLRNEVRLGSPANWNAAMRIARGELIKFLHHDDWLSGPTSLGRFVEAMQSRPDVNFAFSATTVCEVGGRQISRHTASSAHLARLNHRPGVLHFGNLIGAPSATIFRRQDGFQFDVCLQWVVDIDAYLQLLGSPPQFEYIPEALVCVTSTGAHQVTRHFESDKVSRNAEHFYLYAKHTPSELRQRIGGLLFLFKLLEGCSGAELKDLANRRQKMSKRTMEEIVALSVRSIKYELTEMLRNVRHLFTR